MSTITLGGTDLRIEKNGFGCLPIQRVSVREAVRLLHKALDGGINYFDSARNYTDSEEKMGEAFRDRRDKVVLATKSHALTGAELKKHLEESLRCLGTDYIDVYQFHNPPFCPRPGGEDGLYDAALEAQREGKIRFISLTNHRLGVAREAVESGLYATLQFPYSYLRGEQEQELVEQCLAAGMGFIAMKGMAGGLLRDGRVAAAWMGEQPGVVPIWGVQKEAELDQFLSCIPHTPPLTQADRAVIEKDRAELTGEFCRSCGYCMPCPAGIQINQCARMGLMLRRMREEDYVTEYWQNEMRKIEGCLHCGQCAAKCPYGLDTPRLLEDNYKTYWTYIKK